MESRTPSIIDLGAELAKLTMFRGRTPQSTMADRKGSGAGLASYRDGALFTTKFAGKGHWESHLTGDELIHILDGTATLEIVREEFTEQSWQAFWLVAVERRTPEGVVDELGMSLNAIYLAKSKILRRLREEFAGLIDF